MTPAKKIHFSRERCTLIGMIHLDPILEGRHHIPLGEVEAKAVEEAKKLQEAGFDAVLIENLGDAPYYPSSVPPHTVAGMTRVGSAIKKYFMSCPGEGPLLGINVMRNDAQAAIAIAAATGASFVRVNVHSGTMVTDQGLLQGQAHVTVRYRDQINPDCRILADIRVKHAASLVERPLEEEAKELWRRANADALILTGTQTGSVIVPQELRGLHHALPNCPLIAGSGVTPEQASHLLPYIQGIIVGTWLKQDGDINNPISFERAQHFVETVREYEKERG